MAIPRAEATAPELRKGTKGTKITWEEGGPGMRSDGRVPTVRQPSARGPAASPSPCAHIHEFTATGLHSSSVHGERYGELKYQGL